MATPSHFQIINKKSIFQTKIELTIEWETHEPKCGVHSRSCLPLEMVGGKSSWVDVSVCIGIWTNIDSFGYGIIDVLNLGPSRLAKEASRCNERDQHMG